MKFKYLSIALFIIFSFNCYSLPVIINGKSAAGEAFVFRVYIEQDALSGLQYLADQQRPSKSGEFMLGFEAKEIQLATIKVGLQSMKFYVIPGKTYQLNFNQITIEDQNLFLPEYPLKVIFENEDMLNIVLDGFEYEYQSFLNKNFIPLIKFHDKSLYEKFAREMYQKLEESPLKDPDSYEFVKSYIHYKFAELQLVARIQKTGDLGLHELSHQKILINNPAYIGFFKKYFDKYFMEVNDGAEYLQIKELVNKGLPITRLLDHLGKDPVLVEERLREMALLFSLKQVFYDKDYKQSSINEILNYYKENSKFEENRKIASQLFIALNRFVKGRPIPAFYLDDLKKVSKSISHYKGKKTYLMFVSPDCETCEADIRILKSIQKEYADDINFVTIYTGYNKEKSSIWAKKQNATWDFLWFNDDFALLNDYHIKTFPMYILVDERGNLFNYFPPKPRENLISYLTELRQTESKVENREGAKDVFRKN